MTGSLRRAAMALLTAATLVLAPCYAQAQDTSAAGAQTQAQPVTPASVPTEQPTPVPGRDLRLSLGTQLFQWKVVVSEHHRAVYAY